MYRIVMYICIIVPCDVGLGRTLASKKRALSNWDLICAVLGASIPIRQVLTLPFPLRAGWSTESSTWYDIWYIIHSTRADFGMYYYYYCTNLNVITIYMKASGGKSPTYDSPKPHLELYSSRMKPLIGLGLFFLVPSTINVLAKAYTNEDAVIGPDGVKCTLSTVSVREPDNLLTFDDGHCVYSTSTDQCQSGVALFQFYSPQNVCPQGTVLLYCTCTLCVLLQLLSFLCLRKLNY